ncbi:helix-turn-helix transcriptional regulator [Mycobacterium sp.]|uniref:helix-turn-helix domain-containing protein n=1 Tax=Mycobacterium sp. TaxID=1785 RepID=UPI002C448F43|nr:helix-turn-helix transcriptional regulator [Mycobacterium sp.]HTY35404.1 helix-turn-helix transcriptional regulator [Mycobacterium sp.]
MTTTPSTEVTTNDLIRGAMALRGYVQRDLAKVLGVTQPQASARLTGRQDWALGEIRKVAAWLRIDVAALVSAQPDFAALVATDTAPAGAA